MAIESRPFTFVKVADSNSIIQGDTAPEDTSKMWLDTSVTPYVLKYYNGSTWVGETEQIATQLIINYDYAGLFGYDVYGVKDWMKYSNGVLELGVRDSYLKGQFTNRELAFLEGTVKASWISNQEMWSKVTQAENRISVGKGADADGSDDRLSLVDEGELGYSLM